MALAKHAEEIAEKRTMNGAAIIYEYQPQPNRNDACDVCDDVDWAELRAFMKPLIEECDRRLSEEKIVVYKREPKTHNVTYLGYMTKEAAMDVVGVPIGGMLLDIDTLREGIFSFVDYLFVSEAKLINGLNTYGLDASISQLTDGIICRREAA